MMTPTLWSTIIGKKSSSSSSSSSSSEENSNEVKLNLQHLSRNEHLPKGKENSNKLVRNHQGARFIKHSNKPESK